MYTEVSNKIVVNGASVPLLLYCRENLVLPNPEYYKKEQMGRWIGNIPRNIVLYEEVAGKLIIPFGELSNIWKYVKDEPVWPLFSPLRQYNYNSNISLYDYQEEARNKALKAKNGIVVMPCGSGKTQTALDIIAKVGGRALWLTHTQDLLNQSLNRAKSVYDIPASEFGTITGGKVNISKGITFATVQTMVNIDLSQYKDEWDIIVVDECHKAIGSPTKVMQFYKVLSALSSRYKIGLTATPKRADGLEKSMFALLGGIIHEVPREAVEANTVPVLIRFAETGYMPNPQNITNADGTLNYAKLVDDIVNDKERFSAVIDAIVSVEGAPSIVLANRVEYLQRLCDAYNKVYPKGAVCLSGAGQGKQAKAERKEALQKLNEGKISCIFATYQLAKEGLDVPNLRYIFFATPEKEEVTVTQSVGRVSRKSEGKKYGTVVDFIDDFGMLRGWAKKRQNIYKKIKCILT